MSPKLHDVYAEDGMTLEQLMAFSVTADHARQEQVWENVSRSGYDEPYQIRRMLTQNTVRASDRRVQFISLDAYEQAGGSVLRDLFEHDGGGWLQDVALLDRLVTDKLKADGTKPLPDRLITELTAHRTLALRDALAKNPAIAFQAVLHNFVLMAF